MADTDSKTNVVELNSVEFIPRDSWEETLSQTAMEANNAKIKLPKNGKVNRMQVVQAFAQAFELVGGVPRLALWADQNPTEFFKLYARLLPSQSTSQLGDSTEIVIKHVLPRTELD